MALTPIPALDRTSATFKTDVDAFFGSRVPNLVTELNALQTDVAASASSASAAANSTAVNFAASNGANLVGFSPTGIGATATTVKAALDIFNQKPSGQEWAENGARVNRIADRLFVGDAIACDGKASPVVGTWVKGVSAGIYEYLESNATLNAPASARGVGLFGAARTSTQSGSAGAAAIGMAGFAYQDYPSGAGAAFGFYSTVIRKSGSNGPTHGMEIDIANMGSTSPALPNNVNPTGLTNALRLCTGGETLGAGTSSYALGIIQNDGAATPTAKFDKGIVFHSQAISGTNGSTGTGIAIAFAKGHVMAWYNNAGAQTSYIYSGVENASLGTSLLFADDGVRTVSTSDGTTIFRINSANSVANYLAVSGAASGSAPTLSANGSDANIDFLIAPKGSGVFQVSYGSSPAATPSAFSATRRLPFKDGNGILWYIPISTTAW